MENLTSLAEIERTQPRHGSLHVFTVSRSGCSLLLSERRTSATTYRGSRRSLPGGAGILPDQRRDDTPVQGERGFSDGEEEGSAGQVVAEKSLAFLRRTGELKSRKGEAHFLRTSKLQKSKTYICIYAYFRLIFSNF